MQKRVIAKAFLAFSGGSGMVSKSVKSFTIA
jgi:hypothetical protein